MNPKTVLAVCCLLSASAAAKPAGPASSSDDEIKDLPTYMKRFEKLNVEQVLNNERVLASHLKCFLNEGPCVQQSRDLKRVIPVIANNGCEGCTEKQVTSIKKSLNFLRSKKPQEWNRLVKIYDPSGTKLNKFLD
ncbi:Insect odorant-binding protein A10/Ejaculatory bulb-specific protein 3 [Cinara cedri]|uniref:Insect odorant-binding protein A10/Ejaculatory bulb-specific protein 3 n=1 Tax=Cinara cedri TaxID=506608 RepID=A0A5E4MVD2_9HEMI|nr:Insect odorant-binding protein A10/Ejaculatory bulb-specific protein 3 [Cinara cedri]